VAYKFAFVMDPLETVLPDKDTTTASSGCAVVGPVASQTVTRSFSISGFGAVCGTTTWNNNAQNNSI